MATEQSSRLWNTIQVKADLLCKGLRPTEAARSIYAMQNPCRDWKTGNVGVHIVLETGSHVLVTVSHSFDQQSPYWIEELGTQYMLHRDGKAVCAITPVSMPAWYRRQTTTGSPMPSIFLHEGRSFLHQAYSGCDFHAEGLACRFCGAGSSWRIGTPQEVGETIEAALRENPAYHACLGGGTRLPLRRNTDYFVACVQEIRSRTTEIPIWVETVPPESDAEIRLFVDSGVTGFGFNIEVWDDSWRKTICPGKSAVPKSRYLDTMKRTASLLGPNRVGSCLIVGLEPMDSSIAGSNELASRGVQPCVLPFRPWDRSAYSECKPCEPEDLIRVSEAAVTAMLDNGVCPEKNQGCLLCEGCTIDHDIYWLRAQEKGETPHENHGA